MSEILFSPTEHCSVVHVSYLLISLKIFYFYKIYNSLQITMLIRRRMEAASLFSHSPYLIVLFHVMIGGY